ncbi:F-box/WD repeat-containing protein 12 [Dipodomys spectabilis]|uniref:F-box/WD repeat-containing protein 12 n=1 Tax=Dipodomys spectabilis TaxID=105255 RepID=UPI001C538787|nr:F-box/WD repeat-containing protein 12 [Dipodomys spectabilis]
MEDFPDVVLSEIFSYLDAVYLLQASQVNKTWNSLASSDSLWRKLCLKKWRYSGSLCEPRNLTWKKFFLERTKQERQAVIWSSPAQDSIIEKLATVPQLGLAITVDSSSKVKVWNCRDPDALATRVLPASCGYCGGVAAFLTKDGPILLIFSSECLMKTPRGSSPVYFSVPFASSIQAGWNPRRENRITVLYRAGSTGGKTAGFVTFDVTKEMAGGSTVILGGLCVFCMKPGHQIAHFLLPGNMKNPRWMGVSENDVVVFGSGNGLQLFSIYGNKLLHFDHTSYVSQLLVDSVHVIACVWRSAPVPVGGGRPRPVPQELLCPEVPGKGIFHNLEVALRAIPAPALNPTAMSF